MVKLGKIVDTLRREEKKRQENYLRFEPRASVATRVQRTNQLRCPALQKIPMPSVPVWWKIVTAGKGTGSLPRHFVA